MARLKRFQPVYYAFSHFIEKCLVDERSLLWEGETVWTLRTVRSVLERLQQPEEGNGFFEKVQRQMLGAEEVEWKLLTDLFYVFSLPSSSLIQGTKRSYIDWAVGAGGLPDLDIDENSDLWQAQKHGFTATGQRYNRKVGQFQILLMLAAYLKEHGDARTAIGDSDEVKKFLDDAVSSISYGKDKAYDMRHAILYMMFPDEYERIISSGDKGKIKVHYAPLVPGISENPDEAIRQIRDALSEGLDGEEPFDFYDDTDQAWRLGGTPVGKKPRPKPPSKTPVEANRLLSMLSKTRNVVLHGPPGTGKTYLAKKATDEWIREQLGEASSRSVKLLSIAEDLDYHDALALTIYLLGSEQNLFGEDGAHGLDEIMSHEVVEAKVLERSFKHPKQHARTTLRRHSDQSSENVQSTMFAPPHLFDRDGGGRWFLTDAGREYVEGDLEDAVAMLQTLDKGGDTGSDGASARLVEWTTFHQSYSYEDFVEGLRPIASEESGEISYEVVDGVFRRVCKRAAADPDNKYVLVIDEVNRGNISKIFGELMTLLEDDKRAGEENPLAVTLPYSGDAFSVPSNLYVVGTMNTADRSIALLDVALRRRFAFVEVMPDASLLENATVEHEGVSVDLSALLGSLNDAIRRDIDRDHQIGHSYFMSVANSPEADRVDMLEFVWNNRVLPLLEEYYYAQPEALSELLGDFLDEETESHAPGGSSVVERARAEGADLVLALSNLASS